jgi:NADH:ubiquinone oxidoreductase subunit C
MNYFFDYYSYEMNLYPPGFHSLNVHYYNVASPEIYLRAPRADNLITADKKYLVPFLLPTKRAETQGFEYFSGTFAVDNFGGLEFCFSTLYGVYTPPTNISFSLVLYTEVGCFISPTQNIYTGARWAGRGAWELVGVYFDGRTSLQRLLTNYSFKGRPLRQLFRVAGYVECFYVYDLNLLEFAGSRYGQGRRVFEFYDN